MRLQLQAKNTQGDVLAEVTQDFDENEAEADGCFHARKGNSFDFKQHGHVVSVEARLLSGKPTPLNWKVAPPIAVNPGDTLSTDTLKFRLTE